MEVKAFLKASDEILDIAKPILWKAAELTLISGTCLIEVLHVWKVISSTGVPA